jgi:putative membrane protein
MESEKPQEAESRSRWPRLFVGDIRSVGEEPDYRFSLANERTFLAWIRTSLALLGGGLAVEKFLPSFFGSTVLGMLLLVLGLLMAASSYYRWTINEVALRTNSPLPASRQPLMLALGVTVAGLTTAALILFGQA